MHSPLPWVVFNLAVLTLLALDLGAFQRRAHAPSLREAAAWSAFWIVLSLAFNVAIYFWLGRQSAVEFFTGYLLEKSLSIDNIFVFAAIFSYMAVRSEFQHKVLFGGILGALILRGLFIFVGVELVRHFTWILYVFGAFLLLTGAKLLPKNRSKLDLGRSPALRLARRVLPITDNYEGGAFLIRRGGRLWVTPLVLVLIVLETSDVIFAVDSIPAIFAVTQDPFIIYTSNVCAILGLRALYFVLASAIRRFRHLHVGLGLILIMVGVKMLVAHWVKIPTEYALFAILVVLSIAVVASLPGGKTAEIQSPPGPGQ
jgi:tellurite resistance protein TerC